MLQIIEKEIQEALRRLYYVGRAVNEYDSDISSDELAETEDGVPIRKLFISNLAERTTYKDLEKLFSRYGTVESCYLRRNNNKNNYAFVTFASVKDAQRAQIEGNKNQIKLHNRFLRVTAADSWHQPDSIENQYEPPNNKDSKLERKLSKEKLNEEYALNDIMNDGIHALNDDCLIHIFLYLPILDRIKIERVCKRWRSVSQESWRCMRKLDFSITTWGFLLTNELRFINTVSLRKVLLRCGQYLKHMDLSLAPPILSRSTLTIIAKLCPNLQTLDATSIILSVSGLDTLRNNCHDITKLSLGSSTYACDKDLMKLFANTKKLKYLLISNNVLSADCLNSLPSDTLEELRLHECPSIQSCYLSKALTKLGNLKHLVLDHCTHIDGRVMEAIGRYCTNLIKLELTRSPNRVISNDMMHITRLENLKTLILYKNETVNNEFLEALAVRCKNIEYLELSGCTNVTETLPISKLPKLKILRVNQLPINDETLMNLHNIKHLECQKCQRIASQGVYTVVQQSPNMELLDLSGCLSVTLGALEKICEFTKCRTNNVILKVYIGGTYIKPEFTLVSPYLQIVTVDLSEHPINERLIISYLHDHNVSRRLQFDSEDDSSSDD